MNALSRSLVACTLAFIATGAVAEPSSAYLAPNLKIGEHLSSVFSKAVAITGPGFHDVVGRVSGFISGWATASRTAGTTNAPSTIRPAARSSTAISGAPAAIGRIGGAFEGCV